jgi:hypothetical protein
MNACPTLTGGHREQPDANHPYRARVGRWSEEETLLRVARVPEAVADAIDKREKYGIPFFTALRKNGTPPGYDYPALFGKLLI